MFKYNSIVTIFKKGKNDYLMPLVKFTVYVENEDEAFEEAKKWISTNIPIEERTNIFCEVAKVESEIEIFKGI
jgi:hypothetical protein